LAETETGPKLIFNSFGAETVAVAEIQSVSNVMLMYLFNKFFPPQSAGTLWTVLANYWTGMDLLCLSVYLLA